MNVVIRHTVWRQTRAVGIGLDDRGDLVANAILLELREDVTGPRRDDGLVGIASAGENYRGLCDRSIRAREPVSVCPSLCDLILRRPNSTSKCAAFRWIVSSKCDGTATAAPE